MRDHVTFDYKDAQTYKVFEDRFLYQNALFIPDPSMHKSVAFLYNWFTEINSVVLDSDSLTRGGDVEYSLSTTLDQIAHNTELYQLKFQFFIGGKGKYR